MAPVLVPGERGEGSRTVEAQQRKIEAQELAIAQLQATQLEATTRLEALEGASGNASTSEDEYSEC